MHKDACDEPLTCDALDEGTHVEHIARCHSRRMHIYVLLQLSVLLTSVCVFSVSVSLMAVLQKLNVQLSVVPILHHSVIMTSARML